MLLQDIVPQKNIDKINFENFVKFGGVVRVNCVPLGKCKGRQHPLIFSKIEFFTFKFQKFVSL